MRIRHSIKLKTYKLSEIFGNNFSNKLKNNFILQNISTNYETQTQSKLNNKYNTNLTEIKEVIPLKNLITAKSNSKLGDDYLFNNYDKDTYNYFGKNHLYKSMIKPKIKMNNILIKNSFNNSSIPKISNKAIINTNINNKIKKNLINARYLDNKKYINKKYNIFPKVKGTKSSNIKISLYEKEKKKQRNIFNDKLREKLLELEECEKKFDVEIFNTLSKLNDEEKRLYDV